MLARKANNSRAWHGVVSKDELEIEPLGYDIEKGTYFWPYWKGSHFATDKEGLGRNKRRAAGKNYHSIELNAKRISQCSTAPR